MIVGVLTTCHTQYTWERSIYIFLFNRTTLQVIVTYLTGALYVHPLWFYKHQHHSWVCSKLFVSCQRWWFQWWFWFVPSVPGYLRKDKPDPWRNPIKRTTYSYLKCIVYDKLLKPRQFFFNNPVLCKNKIIVHPKYDVLVRTLVKKVEWVQLFPDCLMVAPQLNRCHWTPTLCWTVWVHVYMCIYVCLWEKEKHLYSFFFFSNVNLYI
jgi:hypothetical protein